MDMTKQSDLCISQKQSYELHKIPMHNMTETCHTYWHEYQSRIRIHYTHECKIAQLIGFKRVSKEICQGQKM